MAKDRLPTVQRRLLGLAMIGLVVALIAACVLAYNKTFVSVVPVTMRIAQVDNSFLPQAEIRMRGVDVGEVTDITSDGSDAILTLALKPEEVAHISRDVRGQIVPKSLFGERFLSLVAPPNASREPIRAGDVIGRDRSSNAIQTEKVFNDLLPVLVAVRPADIANTLGAINQGLSGRGEELGQTITHLHAYLSKLNPAVPELAEDIKRLPKFTDTYNQAAPDLLEGLADATTTTRTLHDKKGDFSHLFSQLTDTSHDLTDFFDDNGDNIVHLASAARPTLELLRFYSPEYVCFFRRLAQAVPMLDTAFNKGQARPQLKITGKIVAGRGKYLPHQDEPEITDTRGPRCYDNTPPLQQYPGGPAQDGSTHPPAAVPGSGNGPPGGNPIPPVNLPGLPALPLVTSADNGNVAGSTDDSGDPTPPAGSGLSGLLPTLGGTGPGSSVGNLRARLSFANSAPERSLIRGLVADMTGTERALVPAWSSLLIGPLVRGTDVTVR